MSKLILAMFTSLDGYIEPESGFEAPPWSDEVGRRWPEVTLREARHIVYGRVNFEAMKAFWSASESDPDSPAASSPYAASMNALPKTVFSRQARGDPGWNGRIATRGLEEEVARLKSTVDGSIYSFGGAGMANSLVKADLVDEYLLLVAPVLWGGGKRLFEPGFGRRDLELMASHQLDVGSMIMRYRRKV